MTESTLALKHYRQSNKQPFHNTWVHLQIPHVILIHDWSEVLTLSRSGLRITLRRLHRMQVAVYLPEGAWCIARREPHLHGCLIRSRAGGTNPDRYLISVITVHVLGMQGFPCNTSTISYRNQRNDFENLVSGGKIKKLMAVP